MSSVTPEPVAAASFHVTAQKSARTGSPAGPDRFAGLLDDTTGAGPHKSAAAARPTDPAPARRAENNGSQPADRDIADSRFHDRRTRQQETASRDANPSDPHRPVGDSDKPGQARGDSKEAGIPHEKPAARDKADESGEATGANLESDAVIVAAPITVTIPVAASAQEPITATTDDAATEASSRPSLSVIATMQDTGSEGSANATTTATLGSSGPTNGRSAADPANVTAGDAALLPDASTAEEATPQPAGATATRPDAAALATAASAIPARTASSSSHSKDAADRIATDPEPFSSTAALASDVADGEPNPAVADTSDHQHDADAAADQKAPGTKADAVQDKPAPPASPAHGSAQPATLQSTAIDHGQLAAAAQQQATQAANSQPTAPAAQLTIATAASTSIPLNGLAVDIALKAAGGNSRFEIRLDPAELGRIDVRLDVDKHGQVTSHLTVERPATLDMLRRDAQQLQQALEDAGLKTGDGGLQFSLRDQSSGGQGDSRPERGAQRLIITEDDVVPLQIAERSYGRALNSRGGLDIRI